MRISVMVGGLLLVSACSSANTAGAPATLAPTEQPAGTSTDPSTVVTTNAEVSTTVSATSSTSQAPTSSTSGTTTTSAAPDSDPVSLPNGVPTDISAIDATGRNLVRIVDGARTVSTPLDVESVGDGGQRAIDIAVVAGGEIAIGLCCEPEFGSIASVDPDTGSGFLALYGRLGEGPTTAPLLVAFPAVAFLPILQPLGTVEAIQIVESFQGTPVSATTDGLAEFAVLETLAGQTDIVFFDWRGADFADETHRTIASDIELTAGQIAMDSEDRVWLVDGSSEVTAFSRSGAVTTIVADSSMVGIAFDDELTSALLIDADGGLSILRTSEGEPRIQRVAVEIPILAADW